MTTVDHKYVIIVDQCKLSEGLGVPGWLCWEYSGWHPNYWVQHVNEIARVGSQLVTEYDTVSVPGYIV